MQHLNFLFKMLILEHMHRHVLLILIFLNNHYIFDFIFEFINQKKKKREQI